MCVYIKTETEREVELDLFYFIYFKELAHMIVEGQQVPALKGGLASRRLGSCSSSAGKSLLDWGKPVFFH